ncbi:mitochondrial carrier (BOU / S-adenosylmethionine carrier) [Galdieria sulphuraria]|uniref:Mitochondrial carrier (BOU / S-adenosylmethionine carrier) n=1 Tax=Galdieria sulphuraria TaxID=130081 RepID=M2XDG6_GALSU|nr:mitochondrial carrier (BOU / S-adenosylmethionine carrier) [Galdieria sulphuraria]EME28022.1 mitochondrial carrier (BOU / S-adenosylmethionine carrier) [Galdieria sulphuraria]|eukprot:XP_005704542.1 mitochondrial carrier (BOU / S-adenosylmethionine carrier) [Galdieria sulphuraria]
MMVSDEKGNIPLSFIPHIEEVASTDLSHWQHMIAGAVAGLTETTLMFPLDTVKTRLQSITVNTPNQGLFSCVAEILRKEGFLKLWRGIGAASMTAGPGHAVYFATYEIGKQLFSNNVNEYKPLATAGAGALAALVSDGVFIPFDVVKQRMQLQKTSTSFFSVVSRVYTERGIGAFFAGYTTTLVMEVPYTAVHFATYEGVKHFLLHYRQVPEHQFSISSHLIAGAMAGTVASGLTNPLDVVKTRLQTQGEVTSSSYKNMLHAMTIIFKEEGFRGFLRGVVARMLFHAPSASICFTAYSGCKFLFASFSSARNDSTVPTVSS